MIESLILAVLVIGVTWWFWLRKAKSLKIDEGIWKKQAVSIPGQPLTFGSPLMKNNKCIEIFDKNITNLYDCFINGLKLSKDGPCLGVRKGDTYVWQSYSEVLANAHSFGRALLLEGAQPVGIFARNRPEWFTAALGCVSQNIVVVPLYDTLGRDAARYIINQTDMSIVLCDTVDKAQQLMEDSAQTPSLRCLVVVDQISDALQHQANKTGINIVKYEKFLQNGINAKAELHLPVRDSLYVICYTSGTTGQPKGVMLSHANLVANLSTIFCIEEWTNKKWIKTGDGVISYLPLAHMFEQMDHWCAMAVGAKIGYFGGDIKQLTSDMKVLKPSFFPVVPRLLNRLNEQINGQLAKTGVIGRTIFNIGYRMKLNELKRGVMRKDSIWDKLLFNKIQNQIGGCVDVIVTGSAPIAPPVLELCRVCLSATIVEGYGQTECTAVATSTLPGDTRGGHVGGPSPVAHIRLVDVPELNYYASNGKGEVCVRGPSVMVGYYKEEEKTKETIDAEGWLHTGDIGQWNANGTLTIFDRMKHIFKLAQGEYIAPEKIESVCLRCPYIAQVFVDGSSLETYLVAVVVPESQLICQWFEQQTGASDTYEDVCKSDLVKRFLLNEIEKTSKLNGLNSLETVKKILVTSDAFTVNNNLLTPTLKAKRPNLRVHYAGQIEKLYKENK